MPSPDKPPLTRAVVLRGLGFAIATAVSAVAIWLIVTGSSAKQVQIGVIVGLWGLFIGASAMFGTRRPGSYYDEREVEHERGSALAVRERSGLDRIEDAEARRDFEARLERLVQREISNAVGRETAALRTEIAQLRHDLLEKVGGQLRLERIETTRLIGSDLEALHHEVRQLKVANESGTVGELLGRDSASYERTERSTVVGTINAADIDTRFDSAPAVAQPAPPTVSAPPPAATPQPGPVRPAERVQHRPDARSGHAGRQVQQPAQPSVQPVQPVRTAASTRPSQSRPEQSRPEQARPEQSRSEPSRPEPSRPEQSRSEQSRPEQVRSEQARGEQARTAPAARAESETAAETTAERPAVREVPTVETAAAAPAPPRAERPVDPSPAEPDRTQAEPPRPEASRPEARPEARPEVSRPTVEQSAGHGARGGSDDPFASLPRLSPFTDFGPDPEPAAEEPIYTGRRRRRDDDAETPTDPGRHSRAERTEYEPDDGGRRRRADDATDGGDLLARLLARESAER